MKLRIIKQGNPLKFNKVITLFGKLDIKKDYPVWSIKIKNTSFVLFKRRK